MSRYRMIDDPLKEDWDSLLNNFSSGNLHQSFEYGEVAKMCNPHTRVMRLLALDGDRPVGLVQARYNRRFGFGEVLEIGGLYGYGPVVADEEDKEEVSKELVAALEKWAIRERVLSGSIYRPEMSGVLENLGYVLANSFNTYKVGLSTSVEKLWRSIAHNKRRNIRKAQEQGVEVIKGSSYDDLISFYEMLGISAKRAGFTPHSFDFFHSCLKIFGAHNKSKIFFASVNNQPVASVFVVVYSDTAYALAAGSSKKGWHVRPNDILHWKAMEWACSKGLSYYHLGSVSEPLPTEGLPQWGLWRWKREWNGQLEKTFVYDKIYMPRFRKFLLIGARARRTVLHRKHA